MAKGEEAYYGDEPDAVVDEKEGQDWERKNVLFGQGEEQRAKAWASKDQRKWCRVL